MSGGHSGAPAPAPAGGAAEGKQRALLDAAARILAQEGPQALSVRRLAAEVGTSTMAIYTWYGGKPQLMRAVFREAFSRFRDRLVDEPAAAGPLASLVRLGWAYRAHALAEPNLYAVMFGRSSALFDPGPGDRDLAAGTFEIAVGAVTRCVRAGILRCDPREGAWQLWAAVHGAVSLELAQGPAAGRAAEDAFRGLMRTVLVGLGAGEASVTAAVRPRLPQANARPPATTRQRWRSDGARARHRSGRTAEHAQLTLSPWERLPWPRRRRPRRWRKACPTRKNTRR